MKKSRLRLFKTTSLTISLIGIILILLTIGVVGYIIVTDVTNSVSTTVNSGSAYDNQYYYGLDEIVLHLRCLCAACPSIQSKTKSH